MHGFEGEYDSGNKHYRRIAEVIMVMYAPRGTAAVGGGVILQGEDVERWAQ